MLEELNTELETVKVKYLEEVKEHHRLNASLDSYKAQGMDTYAFEELAGKFSAYIGMYMEDAAREAKRALRAQEEAKMLQREVRRLTLIQDSFEKERQTLKDLADKIACEKVKEAETDFIATTV